MRPNLIRWIVRTLVAAAAATLWLVGSMGHAETETKALPSIEFFDLGESGGPPAFGLTTPGRLLLSFTNSVPDGASNEVTLYLTPFRDQQAGGQVVRVTPTIVELPDLEAADQRLTFTLDEPVLTLALAVPELPTSGNYRGHLVVVQAGETLLNRSFDLRRARASRPPQLVIEPLVVDAPAPAWPWSEGRDPGFTVTIRNDSDDWQAKGVHLRLIEVTKPEDVSFDPVKDLALTWNGAPAEGLWHTPPTTPAEGSTERTIGPGQQATLSMRSKDLLPGSYTVKLAADATNVGAEPSSTLTATLKVRHNAVWPVLVLILAIVISLIATKGLSAQKQRVALLKRVAELRPAWLREEPSTLAVVTVRAIFNQAERRGGSIFAALFSPDTMSARVETAAQLLGPIARIRRVRQRIEHWNQPKLIGNRAGKRLREITALLDPESAGDKQTAEINAQLDELETWLSSDRLYELYWADLKDDVEQLQAGLSPEMFDDPKHQKIVDDLLDQMKQKITAVTAAAQSTPPAPNTQLGKDYTAIEADYAKLKVLWERQEEDDQDSLTALCTLLEKDLNAPLETFFRLVDDIAWERLKEDCKKDKPDDRILRFVAPRESTLQPLTAYQLIEFEVGPSDAKQLTTNYLFKHGLEYRWRLSVEISRRSGGYEKKELLTEASSNEPRVIQYVPHKGRLHVEVDLCREGKCGTPLKMHQPREIAASSDFGWTSAFRYGEVAASLIAALFAIVSGMATFYFDSAVFGTPQDYIALFIWGAGVDQTKNFIQQLQSAST